MDELRECPVCHEDLAFIETEGGWCVYVQCSNCGTHTAFQAYEGEEGYREAVKTVSGLWNMGKIISDGRGE